MGAYYGYKFFFARSMSALTAINFPSEFAIPSGLDEVLVSRYFGKGGLGGITIIPHEIKLAGIQRIGGPSRTQRF